MKRFLIAGIALLLLPLTACAALDVVQTDAVRAFGDLLEVFPAENDGGLYIWRIAAPDGMALLTWDAVSIDMEIDPQPFVNAGLDMNGDWNISTNGWFSYCVQLSYRGHTGPAAEQFGALLREGRKLLGYHAEMDHYNIDLDGGMFEWAKDLSANDKDIVFALDPAPFIAAGVDPERVEGWDYAQVPVMRDGKTVQVWKFLKTFDLK